MANAKRRKRKRVEEEIIWYALRVDDWNWEYLLGINHDRRHPLAFSEYRTLEIAGPAIRPSNLKAERIILHVMADEQVRTVQR